MENIDELRVTEIFVEKLFGVFDHHIPLNKDERVTIIHGENGFGKTILLSLIDALFNEEQDILIRIPFKQLKVSFSNQSYLEIKKNLFSDKIADEDEKPIDILYYDSTLNKTISEKIKLSVIKKTSRFFSYSDVKANQSLIRNLLDKYG